MKTLFKKAIVAVALAVSLTACSDPSEQISIKFNEQAEPVVTEYTQLKSVPTYWVDYTVFPQFKDKEVLMLKYVQKVNEKGAKLIVVMLDCKASRVSLFGAFGLEKTSTSAYAEVSRVDFDPLTYTFGFEYLRKDPEMKVAYEEICNVFLHQ
jgi:hypothetical protein